MSIPRAEIADKLFTLIRPYYKGLRTLGEPPEFRKSMRGDEVEQLLLSLHNIIVELKRENNGNC